MMFYSLLIIFLIVAVWIIIYNTNSNESKETNDQLNLRSLKTKVSDDRLVERYTLVVSKSDNSERILVNGTSPGPTLRFQPNKWYEVLVINDIMDDFTAIHWHGFEQKMSFSLDGSITNIAQCPITNKSGKNHFIYSFKAPEFPGAYFYHGHYKEQHTDGLYGAIIVDDRNTVDDWVIMMSDLYEQPAAYLLPWYLSPPSNGNEPIPDAIIVNGLLTDNSLQKASKSMKNHTVHVINVASFSRYTVNVDGLPLVVTNIDGTPLKEITYNSIVLNVAQRTSFILDFSKLPPSIASSPSIWFRVTAIGSVFTSCNASSPHLDIIGELQMDLLF